MNDQQRIEDALEACDWVINKIRKIKRLVKDGDLLSRTELPDLEECLASFRHRVEMTGLVRKHDIYG